MIILKRGIPVAVAVIVGLLVLGALLLSLPVGDLILNWAGFLTAVALLMGIINLLGVHIRRSVKGNLFSVVLVLSLLSVLALAISDAIGLTQQGVSSVFNLVQAPLEAALASLVVFFMLFAAVRMLRGRTNVATIIFLMSTLFFLLTQLPTVEPISSLLSPVRTWITSIVVISGMRGLLLGIALGVITLSVRLLIGLERPYTS